MEPKWVRVVFDGVGEGMILSLVLSRSSSFDRIISERNQRCHEADHLIRERVVDDGL